MPAFSHVLLEIHAGYSHLTLPDTNALPASSPNLYHQILTLCGGLQALITTHSARLWKLRIREAEIRLNFRPTAGSTEIAVRIVVKSDSGVCICMHICICIFI